MVDDYIDEKSAIVYLVFDECATDFDDQYYCW